MNRIAILICGVILASCTDNKPLTALEEDYFHSCQKGGLELAQTWSKGFGGNISGEEKASRLRKLRRNVEKKCECEARAFSEILTVTEYKNLIKSTEVWAAAHAGRLKDGESEAVNWIDELPAAKLNKMVDVEKHCPGLLDGVGPG